MKSLEITRERRALVLFLAILLVGFVYVMRPFLIPMILSAIIAVLFYPLYAWLKNRIKRWPRLCSLLSTLIVFVIIILPAAWVVSILINQLYSFIGTLDFQQIFGRLFSAEYYVTYVDPWIKKLEGRFESKIDLLGMATNVGKDVAKYIYIYSPSVLMTTANFVLDFFIMMVGTYFLFLEGPQLLKMFYDISPLRDIHERRLSRRVKETIDASIYGYLVTGIIQGVLAGIIFALVGIHASVILGVLTFFMSMVPVIGAAGVWLPACLVLFISGEMWQGAVVLGGGIGLISSIDNFIKPLIIKGRAKIHPLLIFFSLFGGIQLFGPLGILFGPVVTALLIAVIKIYREEYLIT